MRTNIIWGPPGTGKTTRLIEILEQEMASGIQPNRIAFCSFTKKAADEAKDRAKASFGFADEDLPYFRTLHSLAFKELDMSRDCVFGWKDRMAVGAALNLKFSKGSAIEDSGIPSNYFTGDRYSFLDSYSRARCMSPEKVWHQLGGEDLQWWEFDRYLATMKQYKQDHNLKDFQDMIDEFVMNDLVVDVDVAVIDEAQDLSTSQWMMINGAFKNAKRIYIAGDDDQAIYEWSGADVNKFLQIKGKSQTLNHSYRLPHSVWAVAKNIAGRITNRHPKVWDSRKEAGFVEHHACVDSIDITNGNWLLLARNIYMLNAFVALAREQGVPYTYRNESVINPDHVTAIKLWEQRRKGKELNFSELKMINKYVSTKDKFPNTIWHEALTKIPYDDRLYYISLLRAGHSLTKLPNVAINTIHGTKGGEADNVALITDLTERTFQGMQTNYDSEARCFYVGVTRAKHQLHIVAPQTRKGFEI